MAKQWRRAAVLVGAVVVGASLVATVSAEAATVTYNPSFSFVAPLERAPYVTDLQQTTAEVNWATSGTTPGYAEYGPTGSCTLHKITAGTKLPAFVPNVDNANATTDQIKISPTDDYQYSVQLTGLSAGTSYCYEVFTSANVNMLGSGVSQSFSTLDAPTSTASLTFDVVGDLGETTGIDESSTYVNEDQAAIDDEIGASGAKFIVTAGDVAYSGGTDTDYGDMTKVPTSSTDEISNIFGQAYWPQTKGIPVFAGDGNHGQIITGLRTWPEETTVAASSGTYALDPQTVDGVSGSYPDDWYAVQDGDVRIYVLDVAWGDSADGTQAKNALCTPAQQSANDCKGYQNDDDAHWQPTSAEMMWLKNDLKTHPGGVKMAVFHYPVQSVGNNQPSDPYIDRDLVPVLAAGGVSITFSGHNHTYQRFSNGTDGLTASYVTGGGGGGPEPVDGNNDPSGLCHAAIATESVYAIGYGTSGSSACTNGNTIAQKSMSAAQVYNFLKVTVNGTSVTVTPMNALNEPFDSQTYTVAGSSPPTTTTTTTSTTVGSTTTTTSGSGGGTVKLVTSAGIGGTTVTLPQAATTGDLLVYSASQYTGATNHISGVSDNAGDKWTELVAPDVAGSNSEGELWYTYATGSVSTVTATTKATSIASEVQVFSGVKVGAVPASGSGSAKGTAASASTSANSLEVGFVAGHGNSEAITLASGLTPQPQVPSAAGTSISTLITGYETTGGTGTFSGTFPTAMYWASGVAVFPAG